MDYESYATTSSNYDSTRQPIGVSILLGCFAMSGRPLSDQVILDAGCGTGSYALELARWVKRVEGVDACPAMLQQAERKAQASGILDIKIALHEGDIAATPFEDDQFDCVVVNQVLHHIDDDASAEYPRHTDVLREFKRVLRSNGTLVINVCSPDQLLNGFWYRELFPDAFERLKQRLIPIPTLIRLLGEVGFAHQDNVVPVNAVFQGKDYLNPTGPLDLSWRHGDSVFALATESELESGCSRIRAMQQDGTLSHFVEQHDSRRHSIGQVTFVHCTLSDGHDAVS